MARRSRRSSPGERDASDIANLGLLDGLPFAGSVAPLLEVEDRRQFTPAVYRPARTFRGWARLGLSGSARPNRVKPARVDLGRVSFSAPGSTVICVRRSRRREVLHALRKTGRGSGGGRKRRNEFSSVSCRRR